MTNSKTLTDLLTAECANRISDEWHRHVSLKVGHRCKLVQTYPSELVIAILKALNKSLAEDEKISSLDLCAAGPHPHERQVWWEKPEIEFFWDGVNGGFLEPQFTREARRLEIDWVRAERVYQKVPRQMALDEDHKPSDLR